MRLHPFPFYEIKSGKKKIEIRLYDEKRRKVKKGDIIAFMIRPDEKKSVKVRVNEINIYKKYSDLIKSEPEAEGTSLDYYSREDMERYGFVVFHIKKIV
jgi:ASC-1-like (ASCH) protein